MVDRTALKRRILIWKVSVTEQVVPTIALSQTMNDSSSLEVDQLSHVTGKNILFVQEIKAQKSLYNYAV